MQKKTTFKNFWIWLLLLLLVACGSQVGPNERPTAGITGAPSDPVDVGTQVTLNASTSSDPENADLSYDWELTSRPSGSTAQLSSTDEQQVTFTPDISGDYTVRLTVSDGQLKSEPVSVTISAREVGPQEPTVDIQVQTAAPTVGSEVTLTANASNFAAQPVTYNWSLTAPEGSDVTPLLNSTTAPTVSFIPTVEGDYTAMVTISGAPGSDEEASASETFTVSPPGGGDTAPPEQSNLGISATPDGPYQPELTATAPTTFYVQGTFTDPSGLADIDIRWLQPDGTAVTITPTPSPDMPFTRVGGKNSACEPDINPEGGSTPTTSTCTFQIEVAETASPETYRFIFRASDTNANRNSSDNVSPVTLILQ